MLILSIRTDKPKAELGLYGGNKELAHVSWQAHRELSSTIHKKIEQMLNQLSISLSEVDGLICYKGPGSFTGLRIGLSVVNALAYSQGIPVVASSGKDWRQKGTKSLLAGKNDIVATPAYSRPPSVT